MKVKKIIIASLVNGGEWHSSLTDEEKKISALMPLISEMFPGINYYSISGFGQVMNSYVIPVLEKMFSDLIGVGFDSLDVEELVEIGEILPSKGYEHDDNPDWIKRLQEKITAL
jgi:hypothetical protein